MGHRKRLITKEKNRRTRVIENPEKYGIKSDWWAEIPLGNRKNGAAEKTGRIYSIRSIYPIGSISSIGSTYSRARHRNEKKEKQGYILKRVPPRAGSTNGTMARASRFA